MQNRSQKSITPLTRPISSFFKSVSHEVAALQAQQAHLIQKEKAEKAEADKKNVKNALQSYWEKDNDKQLQDMRKCWRIIGQKRPLPPQNKKATYPTMSRCRTQEEESSYEDNQTRQFLT